MKKLIFFSIAGSIGFTVDAGILLLLLRFTPLDPFSARIFAIMVAMSCTWLINRNFTFQKTQSSITSEGMRYSGIGLSSSLLNYFIYAGLLFVFPDLQPVLAVVVASLIAMGWSYFGYSRFVYGNSKKQV